NISRRPPPPSPRRSPSIYWFPKSKKLFLTSPSIAGQSRVIDSLSIAAMATLQLGALVLGFSVAFMLISPSHSLTCTSQTFTNHKLYTNCADLPTLSAFLHWSYNSTTSSLSIAFVAPPAKPDGWIAWGINPTATGMIGTQALIAFKQSNGSMKVDTYNISSPQSVVPSKISFAVSDMSAEDSGGLIKIFATLALPENTTSVNQVWQVGGSVTNGLPDKHAFDPANMKATGTLDLVQTTASGDETAPTASPVPGPNPTAEAPSAPHNGGDSRIGNRNAGFFMTSLFLAIFVICF
ncbi:hypothetical protein U1Q18_033757, partial [Sarracenia purpurea var. burkii]